MSAAAEPIARHASGAGSGKMSAPSRPLKHPTPDLQGLQGAYTRNIARLERSAEDMSAGGSDIGEEIRKMNELSRQSSIQSSHHGDISVVRPRGIERMGSEKSSRAGSYGRGGSAARWGGYSPLSPVEPGLGSWSQPSLGRVASGNSSRLTQMSVPLQEGGTLGSPLLPDSAVKTPELVQEAEVGAETEHSREASQSSFARHYDEIADQIQESLQHVPPSPPKTIQQTLRPRSVHWEVDGTDIPDRPQSADTFQEAEMAFRDFDGVHFSPDTDEFVEVDEHGRELRRFSARSSTGHLSMEAASLLRTSRARPTSYIPPPPEDGMVFYPAPVPKMLNLPKRLSQLPEAIVQAKRRSAMLSGLPPEARAAAPWLSQENLDDANPPYNQARHSRGPGDLENAPRNRVSQRMSMSTLPAHIRASMYFEHQPIRQDVEIKSESAVATLDSILAASASAPAHAFTDHPYVGDVRKSVYAPEPVDLKRLSVQSSPKDEKKKKRRSSSLSKLLHRTTSNDEITSTLQKRGSKGSLMTDLDGNEGPRKLRKRKSQMSFADGLDEATSARMSIDEAAEPNLDSGLVASAQNSSPLEDRTSNVAQKRRVSFGPATAMSSTGSLNEGEQIEEDFEEEEADEDLEDADVSFVQPSTLLAELQIRKAQQKSRSKTAATHYPQGMHSTLLQLDAVEEISKRKRKTQRIALAWEDPHQRALEEDYDKGDEDVPLARLFPSTDGRTTRKVGDGKDWERPLGLMEKRELEDNEPLSSRRQRLTGKAPSGLGAMQNGSQATLPKQPDAVAEGGAADEDEGETLGQRMKRMQTKQALDTAISDVALQEGERPSGSFADEVLGQFGGLEVKDNDADADASPAGEKKPEGSRTPEGDETLGQRRERLQREREERGEPRNVSDGSTRREIRSTNSLAHLLAANPVGQRQASKNYVPTQGTLLHSNAQTEAMQKSQLRNTNRRSSSYYLDKSFMNSPPQNAYQPHVNGMLAQQHQNWAPHGGFAGGMFNNAMGGVQLPTSGSTHMLGMNSINSYFPSPTAGIPYAGYGYPQQTMNPFAYNPMSGGMGGNGFMGFPGMNGTNNFMGSSTYAAYAQNMGGAGMGITEEQMTTSQRAAIDRWRLSVAPQ